MGNGVCHFSCASTPAQNWGNGWKNHHSSWRWLSHHKKNLKFLTIVPTFRCQSSAAAVTLGAFQPKMPGKLWRFVSQLGWWFKTHDVCWFCCFFRELIPILDSRNYFLYQKRRYRKCFGPSFRRCLAIWNLQTWSLAFGWLSWQNLIRPYFFNHGVEALPLPWLNRGTFCLQMKLSNPSYFVPTRSSWGGVSTFQVSWFLKNY